MAGQEPAAAGRADGRQRDRPDRRQEGLRLLPKPDPALLDPSRYPFRTSLEPRFGDLDVNLHVNNVALMGLVEEARARFHRANGYVVNRGGGSAMIVSFAIEFVGEAFYPEALDFHAALSHLGTTSHAIDLLATQGSRPVAWCRSVIVNTVDGKPAAFTEAYRESAKDWMLRA